MGTALERHYERQRLRRTRRLRILALAERAGLTQSMGGIARAAGLTTTTVVAAVDRTRETSVKTIQAIATALGVSSHALTALLTDDGGE